MKFATLTALTLAIGLTAGCAIDPSRYRESCDWAEPIRPSRGDVLTDEPWRRLLRITKSGSASADGVLDDMQREEGRVDPTDHHLVRDAWTLVAFNASAALIVTPIGACLRGRIGG